jgi:hypothetical protein
VLYENDSVLCYIWRSCACAPCSVARSQFGQNFYADSTQCENDSALCYIAQSHHKFANISAKSKPNAKIFWALTSNLRGVDWWKNRESKISCYCLFNLCPWFLVDSENPLNRKEFPLLREKRGVSKHTITTSWIRQTKSASKNYLKLTNFDFKQINTCNRLFMY